jgi:DNA polymerase III alpha subunit (gram-positive type)
MKPERNKIVTLFFGSAIISLLLIPLIANAQAIKTTVKNILANPDKYDEKIVQVQGKVVSPKFKTSKKGNPYTTFKLTDEGSTLSVFSFGTLSIKEGNIVRVSGIYQQSKFVMPRYTFYNEIDASGGSVEKVR